MSSSSQPIDRLSVTFDDPTLVANAGLLLPLTLAVRLGIESVTNGFVRIRARNGAGSRPGRKLLSLVATILAGGSHIDHADILRAGATQSVLPFVVMAPSTLGTFLRSFTFGHVRQLDRVLAELLFRAWSFGAGPTGDLVIDMDSTICEVSGKKKQGAAYGYTRVLGYHPLLATRADTGEVLHGRMRKGSSQRGTRRFVSELVARVRRCGATGEITLRADSGFFSYDLIEKCKALGVRFSITVNMNTAIKQAIEGIEEGGWKSIGYTDSGEAEVAQTSFPQGRRGNATLHHLVVRRTKLNDPGALQLWPGWRYHAFITDIEGNAVKLDEFHRKHATVELAIRDLKEGSGLEHCPSGRFEANAAWLCAAVLAHNLIRWSIRLGDVHSDEQLTVVKTWRRKLLAIPARIVNRSGRLTLRMPFAWPWKEVFVRCLDNLRTLPAIDSG